MLTNTFQNVSNPKVQTLTDIPTILSLIKNNPHKKEIETGRQYTKGHQFYEGIKNSLPTFTPNGCFNIKRSVKTLHELSGCIYLDVDNSEVGTETFQNLPWIYSSWKSFGGNGYNLLVSASGLTSDNFKNHWSSLEWFFKQMDVTIDPHCKDIARQSVISSDPDIYINPNVIPYVIPTEFYISTITNPITSTCDTLNTEYNPTEQIKIKYQTILDSYDDLDCIVLPDGKEYRNTYLPRIIPVGKRHKWISSFTSSLLFNNPMITKDQLKNNVHKVNIDHCQPHLTIKEINSLVSWSITKHKNNQLKIKTKKKKIWINPYKKLTSKQKRSIIGKESGKIRKDKTIQSLIEVYKSLVNDNPKVTQKLVEQHATVKLRTIKKYWNEIIKGVLC